MRGDPCNVSEIVPVLQRHARVNKAASSDFLSLCSLLPTSPLPIWRLRWWRNCPQRLVWPFQSLTRGKKKRNDTVLRAKSETCQAAAADGGLSGALANKAVSVRWVGTGEGGGWVDWDVVCQSVVFAFTWNSSWCIIENGTNYLSIMVCDTINLLSAGPN